MSNESSAECGSTAIKHKKTIGNQGRTSRNSSSHATRSDVDETRGNAEKHKLSWDGRCGKVGTTIKSGVKGG